jgi:hypothetical protein
LLRLSFRSAAKPAEPDPPEGPPEIDFVAYAEDCVLSGRVRLAADRLSDLVNQHEQIELVDVLVSDLVGGDAIEVHEMIVNRDEILVLDATGPRGREDRRHRTRQVPIVARLGPYEVSGYLHVVPGHDPLASLRRGRALVALSDAVIAYEVGGEPRRRDHGTALVNWVLADSIIEVVDKPDDAPPEVLEAFVVIDGSVARDPAAPAKGRRRSGVAGAA